LNARPLADRILVKRVAEVEKTKTGLFIPEQLREKPQEGIVAAIGDGKTFDNGTTAKPKLAIGNRILFGKFSGSDIVIEGEEYLILREDEVLVVLY